jgi:hypothetical protein
MQRQSQTWFSSASILFGYEENCGSFADIDWLLEVSSGAPKIDHVIQRRSTPK